jgi:hypothetical protein
MASNHTVFPGGSILYVLINECLSGILLLGDYFLHPHNKCLYKPGCTGEVIHLGSILKRLHPPLQFSFDIISLMPGVILGVVSIGR